MLKLFHGLPLLAIGLALTMQIPRASGQLEQLATRVPGSANALVVVDVKSAFASPLAQSQDWNRRGLQAQRAGMIALPVGADQFLMAAQLDYEIMQPIWEVAVAYVQQMPAMEDIAARSGGRLDRLAGAPAVERPNDSFVVSLATRILGAMAPANRQLVIRWIRESSRKKSPDISSYLALSLAVADEPNNHIVLALDLQGILAPAEVASELKAKQSLLPKAVDVAALSELIASIRGIRLEVELQTSPQAQLTIDFDQDPALLGDLAKPLLLDVLEDHGAEIEDMHNWQTSTAATSIVLQGSLSPSGLRRVLSVLSSPVGPMAHDVENSESIAGAIGAASQRYFQSTTNYLNDLFFGDRRPQSLHQIKVWVERYARKIEDLDTSQVDEELVAYGRDVAASLQEIVSVLNRAEMRTDLRESNLYEFGRRRYVRYGAYGYYEKPYVTRDRQLVQVDEASRGLQDASAIVEELQMLSARTRKTMSERYSMPF